MLNLYQWYYLHYWLICRYGLLLSIGFVLGLFVRELVSMMRKD